MLGGGKLAFEIILKNKAEVQGLGQESQRYAKLAFTGVLQCVAVCCSVLQCVAVCCSVVQCVAVW